MDAVDWSGLGFIAALVVGCIGYLSRQQQRSEDRLRADLDVRFGAVEHRFDGIDARLDGIDARFDRVDSRLDRLEERYVRHLEQHATGHPA
jgi:hypothetical protein